MAVRPAASNASASKITGSAESRRIERIAQVLGIDHVLHVVIHLLGIEHILSIDHVLDIVIHLLGIDHVLSVDHVLDVARVIVRRAIVIRRNVVRGARPDSLQYLPRNLHGNAAEGYRHPAGVARKVVDAVIRCTVELAAIHETLGFGHRRRTVGGSAPASYGVDLLRVLQSEKRVGGRPGVLLVLDPFSIGKRVGPDGVGRFIGEGGRSCRGDCGTVEDRVDDAGIRQVRCRRPAGEAVDLGCVIGGLLEVGSAEAMSRLFHVLLAVPFEAPDVVGDRRR